MATYTLHADDKQIKGEKFKAHDAAHARAIALARELRKSVSIHCDGIMTCAVTTTGEGVPNWYHLAIGTRILPGLYIAMTAEKAARDYARSERASVSIVSEESGLELARVSP